MMQMFCKYTLTGVRQTVQQPATEKGRLWIDFVRVTLVINTKPRNSLVPKSYLGPYSQMKLEANTITTFIILLC